MSVTERIVSTSHADVAIAETSGSGLPILLIHGNSSCKEVFHKQMESPMADSYRMIGIDLPGHGRSSNAFEPKRTYSMPGYAEVACEVLDRLGIKQAAVYGWSLGGHIGLEMLPRYPGMVGLMIGGTPPVSPTPESIQGGFNPNPMVGLFGKEEFTDEDAANFALSTYGGSSEKKLIDAVKRTDGQARKMMFESLFAGATSDQRALAEKSRVPLAIVDGADDPYVNVKYVGSLTYANLWDEHCYALRGLGHVPFLQAPEVFNPIFVRFAADMEKRANRMTKSATAAA